MDAVSQMDRLDKTDKKAGLTRVRSKAPEYPHDDEPPIEYEEKVDPVGTAFVPRERETTDTPPRGEKWEVRSEREKHEKTLSATVEARLAPMEQLGLDAGRCALKVTQLRKNLAQAQRSVVTYTQQLAEAEALLAVRIDELKKGAL